MGLTRWVQSLWSLPRKRYSPTMNILTPPSVFDPFVQCYRSISFSSILVPVPFSRFLTLSLCHPFISDRLRNRIWQPRGALTIRIPRIHPGKASLPILPQWKRCFSTYSEPTSNATSWTVRVGWRWQWRWRRGRERQRRVYHRREETNASTRRIGTTEVSRYPSVALFRRGRWLFFTLIHTRDEVWVVRRSNVA